MQKQLICIGGPMGVGKTTVCRQMQARLDHCVFLDGDWCWDAHPFINTPETRAMAVDNIRHLLNGFLGCTAYETVLFCWVFHQADILPAILSGLERAYRLYTLSLVCPATTLAERLWGDVGKGLRQPDVIERSLKSAALIPGSWVAPCWIPAAAPRPGRRCGPGMLRRRGQSIKKSGNIEKSLGRGR